MRGKSCLFSILLLFLFSCQQEKEAAPEELILGEWIRYYQEYDDENIPSERTMQFYLPERFCFFSKDSCKIQPGYITYQYFHPYIYHGNKTSYRLDNDTLKLYNLRTEKWEGYKIYFQHTDTFTVYYETEPVEYARTNTILKSDKFDQLIIFADINTFIKGISIRDNGELLYNGVINNKYDGYYFSKEGKATFEQIEHLFRKEDFSNIPQDTIPHETGYQDGTSGVIFFMLVKDNVITTVRKIFYDDIIKRLKLYSPEFYCTLQEALFLELQVSLLPLSEGDYVYDQIPDLLFYYFDKEDGLSLSLNEINSLYLFTSLLDAKLTQVEFTPIYTVNNKEYTDGRYYRFKNKQGEWITLDIGFNFIENNKLEEQFE